MGIDISAEWVEVGFEVGDTDVIACVEEGAVGGAAKLPTDTVPKHRALESSAHRLGFPGVEEGMLVVAIKAIAGVVVEQPFTGSALHGVGLD